MGAAVSVNDVKTLASFIPLNELDSDKLQELATKSNVRHFKSGEPLQPRSQQQQLYYLLSGTIELNPHSADAEKIKSGSRRAQHPICDQTPKNCRAVAKTAVSVLVIDAELLDLLQGWGSPHGHYEVDEIVTDSSDWMSGLLQNPALINLSPTTLKKLMTTIEPIEVKAGETVIHQGKRDNHYYIIAQGHCRVSRQPRVDAKEITLATLGPGDGFGEEALITGGECNANVSATEHSLILKLNGNNFTELLQKALVKTLTHKEVDRLKDQGAEILDVRSPEEFSRDGTGINLPLTELRLKSSTLDRNKQYIACCEDGKRGAVAAFILSQHGFKVCALSGGFNTHRPIVREDTHQIDEAEIITLQSHQIKQNNSLVDGLKDKIKELNEALSHKHKEIDKITEREKNYRSKIDKLESVLQTTQRQSENRLKESKANKKIAETHLNKVTYELKQQIQKEQERAESLASAQAHERERVAELAQTIATVEADLLHERSLTQRHLDTIEEYQQQQDSLNDSIKKMQAEFGIHQKELEEEIARLRQELSDNQKNIEESNQTLQEENHKLVSELDSKQIEIDKLKREITQKDNKDNHLHEERQSYKEHIEKLEKELKNTQREHQSAKDLTQELSTKLSEIEKNSSKEQHLLSEQIMGLEEQLIAQQTLIETAETESQNTLQEIEALRTKIEQQQAEYSQSLHDLETARSAEEEYKKLSFDLGKKLAILEEQVADITRQYSESIITTEQLNESKHRLAIQLEEKEKEIESLLTKINAYQDNQKLVENKKREIDRLQQSTIEKNKKIDTLSTEIKSLTDNINTLTEDIEKKSDVIDTQKNKLQQQRDEINDLQHKHEELNQQLNILRTELTQSISSQESEKEDKQHMDKLHREIEDQQEAIKTLEDSATTLNIETNRLRKELELTRDNVQTEQKRVAKLETRLDEAQQRYHSATTTQDNLKRELRQLRSKLQRSEKKQAQAEQATQSLKNSRQTKVSIDPSQNDKLESIDKLIAQAPSVDSALSVSSLSISDAELIKMGKEALSETIPAINPNPKPIKTEHRSGYVKPQLKRSVKVTMALSVTAGLYFTAATLLGININTQLADLWQSATATHTDDTQSISTQAATPKQNRALFLTEEERLKRMAAAQLDQALRTQPEATATTRPVE